MCALSVDSLLFPSGLIITVSHSVSLVSLAKLMLHMAIYVLPVNYPAIPALLRLNVLPVLRMLLIRRNSFKVLSVWLPALLRPTFKLVSIVSPATLFVKHAVPPLIAAIPVNQDGFFITISATMDPVLKDHMLTLVTPTVSLVLMTAQPVLVLHLTALSALALSI